MASDALSSVLSSLSPDALKILATEMFKPGILDMLARQTPITVGERFTFKTRRTKREARSSDMATMVDDIERANAAYKPPTIDYRLVSERVIQRIDIASHGRSAILPQHIIERMIQQESDRLLAAMTRDIWHVKPRYSTPEEIRAMRRPAWADPIVIIEDI